MGKIAAQRRVLRGAWLAQVEQVTLDFQVMSSSPMLGPRAYFKERKKVITHDV